MWDFLEMGNCEANIAGVLESIDGGMAENTQNSLICQLGEVDENHEQGNLNQGESMKNYLICSMKLDENHGQEVVEEYRMNAGWKLCHGTEVAVKHLQNNDQVYQGTEMMDQNQIQDP